MSLTDDVCPKTTDSFDRIRFFESKSASVPQPVVLIAKIPYLLAALRILDKLILNQTMLSFQFANSPWLVHSVGY